VEPTPIPLRFQLPSGKSSQCQGSGGTDNICLPGPPGQKRCPIRHL